LASTIHNSIKLGPHAAWLEGIRRVESPNQDERPDNTEITLLVIHGISLPPGEFGGGYIDQMFMNNLDCRDHPYFAEIADTPVSAHIFIDREGKITQYVPFNKRAWHAGASEFMGRQRCNDYSIGVELEGCDDQTYTDEQYMQLAALTVVLMRQWPAITRNNIVGHCHIAPDRKTDPGPTFDWKHYFDLLEQSV
jgi:AmpD protein